MDEIDAHDGSEKCENTFKSGQQRGNNLAHLNIQPNKKQQIKYT